MQKQAIGPFELFRNILYSGMSDQQSVEVLHRVGLLNFISITCIIFIIPLGMIAYAQANFMLGLADHFVAVIVLWNMLHLRKSENYVLASYIGIFIIIVLYSYLFITGGVNNTAHLWFYTFPLGASFLLGSKKGAVATLVLLFIALLYITLDISSPGLAHYSKDFILRFIPSYVVVLLFSFAFEFFRETSEVKLTIKNNELNSTVAKLQQTEFRLRKAREELEQRVRDRTLALSKANDDLKHEIHQHQQAENERRRLEAQLAHSRKMEAIGTLAGGVAHDLNNILSATVSYPDLILMDLPEDSHLKEPVITIQKSGKKAAAIVEDLLTLARRGVSATKVTGLNEVIHHYLDSPEFNRLKEYNPNIVIESNLEEDLLNILGSPVHLSKTIMNLVSNAAEAMPSGGTIYLKTENLYLDWPIKGYDQIKEGDYVVLSVKDTGEGISPGDIERVFEPFFTKKKMGRSGTGLGMAVVWGTVKDHNGYIDIHSTEGRGTTFNLYFPVTRREAGNEHGNLPIDKYLGSGQSILVVDDIKDQREIVTRILSKLGYTVDSVSSGEEAIQYLQQNSVNLIILDMIMEPGLDGLETYQMILESNPNQKAIIASGFSETDRVKQLQNLGAGGYIKKPYTLETIGMAVKAELQTISK